MEGLTIALSQITVNILAWLMLDSNVYSNERQQGVNGSTLDDSATGVGPIHTSLHYLSLFQCVDVLTSEPKYSLPEISSGAAYAGLPQQVSK